jgi:hypothetical protein
LEPRHNRTMRLRAAQFGDDIRVQQEHLKLDRRPMLMRTPRRNIHLPAIIVVA